MKDKKFECFYKLTYGEHYTVGVCPLTGQDWSPDLNEEIYDWLQNNMEYGVNYQYNVGDTTTPSAKDMVVGLDFASEEDMIAFKLRWL